MSQVHNNRRRRVKKPGTRIYKSIVRPQLKYCNLLPFGPHTTEKIKIC